MPSSTRALPDSLVVRGARAPSRSAVLLLALVLAASGCDCKGEDVDPPIDECGGDIDCAMPSNPWCVNERCVECRTGADCGTGAACTSANVCEALPVDGGPGSGGDAGADAGPGTCVGAPPRCCSSGATVDAECDGAEWACPSGATDGECAGGELCTDGSDNDGDGDVDCMDADCFCTEHCFAESPPTTNLLTNPSFEDRERDPVPMAAPTSPDLWSWDLTEVNDGGLLGLTPHDGTYLLQFLATGTAGPSSGGAADMMQVVAADSMIGRTVCGLSWFARVDAPDADTEFALRIYAYEGVPTDFPERWPGLRGSMTCEGDRTCSRSTRRAVTPSAWHGAVGGVAIPASWSSASLAVHLVAIEDTVNDESGSEFHGHAVDDVWLWAPQPD